MRMGKHTLILVHNKVTNNYYYNYIDILALAVFTRSPAAYDALKGFKLLQLPSRRTLKDYISANREKAGECLKHLQEEGKLYLSKIEELKKTKQTGIAIIFEQSTNQTVVNLPR